MVQKRNNENSWNLQGGGYKGVEPYWWRCLTWTSSCPRRCLSGEQ